MSKGSIAKAYVQVIPSAEGLKSQLESILGDEMPSSGSSAGSLFGGGLVNAVTGIIAAAGLGETLKNTLLEGADLQQSLGGAETLFKDSADAVVQNAQQAWRTAGMSANAYLETVTGFSASLLQGLGGDTEKAASVADMALTDMSDNANKMGTDMELIQNAYQGFAKQNYTMLDNLKLGYGGTKTEMERLLADAQELTGVEYDISNLSDVYSAIHVIQEEMGITGTTAKEASSTFSGSLAAMQAAASNVMANLALGADMGPSLAALGETVITFIQGNLIPMLANIFTALPGTLVGLVNQMIPEGIGSAVTTMVQSLTAWIAQQLPALVESGAGMLGGLITGLLDCLPDLLSAAGELLNGLLGAIMAALPDIASSGVSLIRSLASGIISRLPDIVQAAAKLIAGFLGQFASNLPQFLAQGLALIGELIAGIIQAVPQLVGTIPGIIEDVIDCFASTDWVQVGKNILDGIAAGISDGVGAIVKAAKSAAEAALKAAKDFLEIRSPSRRFRKEVGRQSGTAIALGLQDSEGEIRSAMGALSDRMLETDFGLPAAASAGGRTGGVTVVQNIYSQAKTAADLMQEARYQQEMAVILGV